MQKFVSHFQLVMATNDAYLVCLGREDDYGLYSRGRHGARNDFGTPLLARGTWQEMTDLAPDARELVNGR